MGTVEAQSKLVYSCVILAAFVAGTVMRNYVWDDEVRLFTDVVGKSPHKDRPYNHLAWAYYKRGEYDRAAAVLEDGEENLADKGADLWDTLTNIYLKQGKYDKAIDVIKKETRMFTGYRQALAYNNLGAAYLYIWTDLQNRRNLLSLAEFESKKEEILGPSADAYARALEIEPEMSSSLDSYINVMCWRGRGNELISRASGQLTSTQDKLKLFSALYTYGKVAFNMADYAAADVYFERAEQAKDNVKIVYFNHGYALNALKRDDRAIAKYTQAIRIEPIFVEAHNNLGLIYVSRKEYDKAIEAFSQVLRFAPAHVDAHLQLASIYAIQGKRGLAREQLVAALAIQPGNEQAEAMMRQLGL